MGSHCWPYCKRADRRYDWVMVRTIEELRRNFDAEKYVIPVTMIPLTFKFQGKGSLYLWKQGNKGAEEREKHRKQVPDGGTGTGIRADWGSAGSSVRALPYPRYQGNDIWYVPGRNEGPEKVKEQGGIRVYKEREFTILRSKEQRQQIMPDEPDFTEPW